MSVLDRRQVLKLEAAAMAAAAGGIAMPALGANLITERAASELQWNKAPCRRRFGLRWQAKRDTALGLRSVFSPAIHPDFVEVCSRTGRTPKRCRASLATALQKLNAFYS